MLIRDDEQMVRDHVDGQLDLLLVYQRIASRVSSSMKRLAGRTGKTVAEAFVVTTWGQ